MIQHAHVLDEHTAHCPTDRAISDLESSCDFKSVHPESPECQECRSQVADPEQDRLEKTGYKRFSQAP